MRCKRDDEDTTPSKVLLLLHIKLLSWGPARYASGLKQADPARLTFYSSELTGPESLSEGRKVEKSQLLLPFFTDGENQFALPTIWRDNAEGWKTLKRQSWVKRDRRDKPVETSS